MALLHNGQTFPDTTLSAVGGGTIELPKHLAGSFSVVLVYRGAWCPVCNDQLADFQTHLAALDRLGVKVVAFSVDDEPTTAALRDKLHLTFPLGHSADADAIAGAIGSFTNEEPHYLQPTGFILSPEGKVLNALYSSNAMGRITAAEVTKLVTYIKSRQPAAAA